MKKSKSEIKAETIRFLKKTVLFCIGYVIFFTVVMTVIFCVKDVYPETLVTVTFAYFSIEAVVSALIKIFEPDKKKEEEPTSYTVYPSGDPTRNEENYK